MLKGIFGKWLREFATIVLTQTVQAFLLAIVMSIIIGALAKSGSDAGNNQAAGMLAIIALASFGKIEMLVKNIFGVTSQFGDPSLQAGARGLTAGSMLAMKGGKRLLDNGSKLVQSHRQISEAKKGLSALQSGDGAEGAEGADGSGSGTVKLPDGTVVDKEAANQALEAGADMTQTTLQVQGMQDISSLTSAINTLNSTIAKNNSVAAGGTNKEKYEKMLEEGKNLRRSAIRENIGGLVGGTAGAIVGLAKGDQVIETTLAGAGAGDALGEASAKSAANRASYNKRMDKLNKDIAQLSEAEYKKNLEQLETSMASAGLGGVKNRISTAAQNTRVATAGRELGNMKQTHNDRVSARNGEALKDTGTYKQAVRKNPPSTANQKGNSSNTNNSK